MSEGVQGTQGNGQPYGNGWRDAPWYMRVFTSPAVLANVVAFGAALLLLYTAAWEWPRQIDRFYALHADTRDSQREAAAMQRENQKILTELQRLLLRIEALEQGQSTAMQDLKKLITEIWFRQLKEKAPE